MLKGGLFPTTFYYVLVKHYSRKGCYPSCLVKVDIRKVYDTLDWLFIRDMMVALNFPPQFVKIVMACITSTQYALLINGSPSKVFKAKKGLRQGDPLSALLFVIGMEYLSRSLLCLMLNPQFKPHPRCRQLKLNHLCFADDLMLLCKGDLTSIKLLCHTLEGFAQTSDLCPNLILLRRCNFFLAPSPLGTLVYPS